MANGYTGQMQQKDLEVLEKAAGETKKILVEGDNFFKSLSAEEWDEMVKSYNGKKI